MEVVAKFEEPIAMNTRTQWIVVASRDQVRIFSQRLGPHPLELVTEIGNPSGRLRLHDIESDKPGRATDNRMHARHAYSTEEDALTRNTNDFYRQVVEILAVPRIRGGCWDRRVVGSH